MQGEIDNAKSASVESKNQLEKLVTKADEQTKRAIESEQRLVELEQAGNDAPEGKDESLGRLVTKDAGFQAMAERGSGTSRIEVKTAIINTYPATTSQPLVQGDRLSGIHTVPNRRLTIKDILPVGTTASNLVEFTRENAFTNAAAPQRDADSPTLSAIENVTKAESAITFTLATTPVVTLAHFIPVSKQVIADSPQLEAYVNGRLLYGLLLKEETQILLGDTMGQLMTLFGCADIAFVGGSLVDTGCHNVLEPAAMGIPVLVGPSQFNFELICRQLQQAGALITVVDAPDLAQQILQLLSNPESRTTMGTAGKNLIESNKGSLQKLQVLIEEQLPL
jgi:HK97 family phage major capsid protein